MRMVALANDLPGTFHLMRKRLTAVPAAHYLTPQAHHPNVKLVAYHVDERNIHRYVN